MSTQQESSGFAIPNWMPAEAAFRKFCEANPSLGLAGTHSSWIWFRRTHGPALERVGVMRQVVNRQLIVDTERFARVVFEHLTRPISCSAPDVEVGEVLTSQQTKK